MNAPPVIALNRVVAVARLRGAQAGLDALAAIAERSALDGCALYHAVHGSFARDPGRMADALASFQRAAALSQVPPEREFLARRVVECGG